VPDPVGHRYTSAARLVGSATPPERASVNDWAPPIFDQRGKGECVGEATGGAFDTSLRAAYESALLEKRPPPTLPPFEVTSPSWIYKIARSVDRDGPSDPLTDDGCQPNQAVRAIEEFGLLGFDECSDEDKDVNVEATALQFQKASRVHSVGWRQITSRGHSLTLDIMRAIAFAKVAVMFAIDVYQNYEDYSKGILGPELLGQNLGGHMQYLTEYYTTPAGLIVFRVRNSWGDSWGDGGCAWVDDRFVTERMTAVYAASPRFAGPQ